MFLKRLEQHLRCPDCGEIVRCKGRLGERVILVCPSCGSKGCYRFPGDEKTVGGGVKLPSIGWMRFLTLRRSIALCLSLFLGLLFIFLVLLPSMQGSLHFLIALSGSMEPAINSGDIVVSSSIAPEDVAVGDIITFEDAGNPDNCITHRVYEIVESEISGVFFRTKGDANSDPDVNLIPSSRLIGRVVFVVPYLGYIPFFAKSPLGLFFLIILPGCGIIFLEVRNILLVRRGRKPFSH